MKKIGIGVVLLLIGGLLAIGSLGTAIVVCSKDDNGDGVRDCLGGIVKPSATVVPTTVVSSVAPTTTPSATPVVAPPGTGEPVATPYKGIVIGGAVDLNKDGDYTDVGDVAPPSSANRIITITDLRMNTLYSKDHSLYKKIFLLEPETTFTEYITVDMRGGAITSDNRVCLQFSLLEGTLPGPIHKVGTGEDARTKKCVDGLTTGEHTFFVEGKVPAWNPGKDWHLGNIHFEVDGEEVGGTYISNPRLDKPDMYRWLTKKYPDIWANIDPKVMKSISLEDKETKFRIKFDRNFYSSSYIDQLQITQITYPGKYVTVHKGSINTPYIDILFEKDLYQYVDIDKSKFAKFVEKDESYLKIVAWDKDGNFVDLNTAPDDVSARVNIGMQLQGGAEWTSTTEYFDMLGIIAGFSIAGGNHPESMYFS